MVPVSSKKITSRNLKLFWYGDTGTRKTETILRYFPDVLLIDAEGNADKAADDPDIPEFLLEQTKDPREILDIIRKVANGQYKFDDGRKVQTLGIDGSSIVWEVGKDTAATAAERRASRKGQSMDDATPTFRDWGIGKRPIRRIYTEINNSPIPYIIFTAREKPEYEGQGDNQRKVGITYDAMGGIEYEVNVALHFQKEGGRWFFTVKKTQGTLRDIFKEGQRMTEFPIKEIMEYAQKMKPVQQNAKDISQIADENAAEAEGPERNLATLKEEAAKMGITADNVGPILRAAGFTGFKPENWDLMLQALEAAIQPMNGN